MAGCVKAGSGYLCTEDSEGEARGSGTHRRAAAQESTPLSTPSSTRWQLPAASCLATRGSMETAARTPRAVFKVGETQEACPRKVCQGEPGPWGTLSSRNDFHRLPSPWGRPVRSAPGPLRRGSPSLTLRSLTPHCSLVVRSDVSAGLFVLFVLHPTEPPTS